MPKTILITAGPTREYLDPIRFISNESSGQLGWEIAKEAKNQGYKVILVLGPTHLPTLAGIKTIHIQSAKELLKVLKENISKADILCMSAAVADFTPAIFAKQKIKRHEDMIVQLKKNPDLLQILSAPAIKKDKIYVGFCLETQNLIKNAKRKLASKNLDYIVATQYSPKAVPFGATSFSPAVLSKLGQQFPFKKITKQNFAKKLLKLVDA